MLRASTAETYEHMISVLRTAAEVVKEASRELVLLHHDGTYTLGYDAISQHFASIPQFDKKNTIWEHPESKSELKGIFLELELSPDGYEWGEYISPAAITLSGSAT